MPIVHGLPGSTRSKLAVLVTLVTVPAVLYATQPAPAAQVTQAAQPAPAVAPARSSQLTSSTIGSSDTSNRAAAKPLTAQILSFNDFHGHLESDGMTISARTGTSKGRGYVPAGGAGYLAARIEKLARGRNSVTVSAGDLVGASPMISGYYHDEPTIEAMNRILDVGVVGNHEFDEGTAELRRLIGGGCHPVDGCQDGTPYAGATFDELAANVVSRATGEPIFRPYTIKSVGGARIGFIGTVTTDTPGLVARAGIADVRFLDEATTIRKYAPQVRAAGADAVVVLTHSGASRSRGSVNSCNGTAGPAVRLAKAVAGPVDVVLSAHTHNAYVCRYRGVLLSSAASYGRLVTAVRLTIDPVAHQVTAVAAANHVVTHDLTPDRAVGAVVRRYQSLIAPVANRRVTTLAKDISRSPSAAGESVLGDVVADAQWRASAPARSGGAQLAIVNRGFIRTELAKGRLTYGEVYAAQPFGHRLVTMTLTGRQLDRILEDAFCNSAAVTNDGRVPLEVSSSFHFSFAAKGSCGHRVRIRDFRLKGRAMTAGGRYRVVTNDFFAAGENGFPTFAAGTDRVTGALDRDALARYLAARPNLKLPTRTRITQR